MEHETATRHSYADAVDRAVRRVRRSGYGHALEERTPEEGLAESRLRDWLWGRRLGGAGEAHLDLAAIVGARTAETMMRMAAAEMVATPAE